MKKPYLVGGGDDEADPVTGAISPIEDIIEDARNGRPYILVDAEDRENEGDVIIPAQFATPEQINFMARHARGLICLSITTERARKLRLPPMATDNQSGHGTAFTVSIEAREGVTTGISAHDRAHTIAVAVDPTKGADDIVSPGHVFPLVARDGGVLMRFPAQPPGDGWRSGYMFHQPGLELALRERLAGSARVTVRIGEQFTGFTQDDDGVTVALDGPEGARSVRARSW